MLSLCIVGTTGALFHSIFDPSLPAERAVMQPFSSLQQLRKQMVREVQFPSASWPISGVSQLLFFFRYEISFKQQVGTEDVFFGMSRKDPSTACCEDMVIKIKLPETKFSDITLDIQDKVLDLRTPQKKLLLHLPCPVDSKKGKARFLSEEELLEVTLRMKREFDFINFA
uniref:PIH1 domain containing 3 n=1 Tax=Phasianus colchicus TaxID=9054 RepID=A0A669PPG9_PHACC